MNKLLRCSRNNLLHCSLNNLFHFSIVILLDILALQPKQLIFPNHQHDKERAIRNQTYGINLNLC